MESHSTQRIAREILLELGRAAGAAIEHVVVVSDDGLALQAKIGGDVRLLQISLRKMRFFRNLNAAARALVWLSVENAQFKLGPRRPGSRARP